MKAPWIRPSIYYVTNIQTITFNFNAILDALKMLMSEAISEKGNQICYCTTNSKKLTLY